MVFFNRLATKCCQKTKIVQAILRPNSKFYPASPKSKLMFTNLRAVLCLTFLVGVIQLEFVLFQIHVPMLTPSLLKSPVELHGLRWNQGLAFISFRVKKRQELTQNMNTVPRIKLALPIQCLHISQAGGECSLFTFESKLLSFPTLRWKPNL